MVFIIAAAVFCSCGNNAKDEIADIESLFSSVFPPDKTLYTDSFQQANTSVLFKYFNDVNMKKTEWYVGVAENGGWNEAAVIKISDYGYLNSARILLNAHLEEQMKRYSAENPDSKLDGETFAFGEYAFMLIGDAVTLKDALLAKVSNSTVSTATAAVSVSGSVSTDSIEVDSVTQSTTMLPSTTKPN